ncbi:hypothetical protein [uncultured Chitinophaga sp.]|jgi:hypothetical protein|uniref:hypothetical protein n=1 Tax=uncultured Chitinophaga sp. TaxID=339340 RepID=UPI0026082A58|nr:hypothetical protein [uncultured Chitinophaga sp.]
MNIKKSLIVAAVFMSVSAITFAQQPAKPAKATKEAKATADTSMKAAHHHHVKKMKEGAKKG